MDYLQLTQIDIFKGLNRSQIEQLKPLMTFCSFSKDMVIFEQGNKAEFIYILAKGEVAISYKPYDGQPIVVARIHPGNVFGWSSALNRDTYSSAALAVIESEAIRINGRSLQTLCDTCPNTGAIFLDRLAGVISERIRHTHHEILALLSNGIDTDSECLRRLLSNGRKKGIHN